MNISYIPPYEELSASKRSCLIHKVLCEYTSVVLSEIIFRAFSFQQEMQHMQSKQTWYIMDCSFDSYGSGLEWKHQL